MKIHKSAFIGKNIIQNNTISFFDKKNYNK